MQITETFLDEDDNDVTVDMDMNLDGTVVTGDGEVFVVFADDGSTCSQNFDIDGEVH